jgi:hypothetical protein
MSSVGETANIGVLLPLIVWRARAEEGNEEVELDMGGQGFDIDFGGAEDFVPDEIQEQEEEEMAQFSLSQVRDSNVCVRIVVCRFYCPWIRALGGRARGRCTIARGMIR